MKSLILNDWEAVWEFVDNGEIVDERSVCWGMQNTYRLEKDGVNYGLVMSRHPEMNIKDTNFLPMIAHEMTPHEVKTIMWRFEP